MTSVMAELRWGPEQYAKLTFRELFLVFQHAVESRWNFQAALLSEVHNGMVATIRMNSDAKPRATTPADFNPCIRTKSTGTVLTADNFEVTCKMMGDCFLAGAGGAPR